MATSANVGQGTRQSLNSMKDSAADAADTAKEYGKDVLSAVQDFGSDAKRTVQDKVGELRDTAGQYLEQGKNQAIDLERSVEEMVRNQPITSLLVAAGIGIAIGCMVNRR